MTSLTALSPLPDPPTSTDPDNFYARGDAVLLALVTLVQQLNAFIAQVNALGPDAALATSKATEAAASAVNAAASAALALAYAASVSKGIDPGQVARVDDLGTAAWQDMTLLDATATWDAPSIAHGAQSTTTVTVPGAMLGDHVISVSCSIDLAGLDLTGQVSAAKTVRLILKNLTGSAVDLASATYTVRVMKLIPWR